jgi:site-specific DNA-methyltransferase (adenine-specific)
MGFEVLTPIIWSKVANISLEASRSSRFLGKPYLPGGVIKNDRETIVLMRKPGYRKPTAEMERASKIAKQDYFDWFMPIWTGITGASTRNHPAPYPLEIPRRLVEMFSFVGDTVLDPFGGTGTTAEAAARGGRNSISVDVEPKYVQQALDRLSLYQPPVTPRARASGRHGPTVTPLSPRLLDATTPYVP